MAKDMNHMAEKISEWIRKKIEEAGAKGAVIGLSGGVDSSVVAALAKKALGDNVLGMIMPCDSSETDRSHAEMLAGKFGIKTHLADLSEIYKALMESLPEGDKLAKANIKPRLRMLILYYFANLNNYLVLGTGNKTELMIGYFTKYGDGGCDLLPLGSLYKKDVRRLAGSLGMPEEITIKKPSAGLWDGQTDESEIGMSYEELDKILEGVDKEETNELDKEKLEKVKTMIEKSRHKGRMPDVFKT